MRAIASARAITRTNKKRMLARAMKKPPSYKAAWADVACPKQANPMDDPILFFPVTTAPILGIFSNKEQSNISNPHFCNLKENTTKYHFTIQYNPGKWHHGQDACP